MKRLFAVLLMTLLVITPLVACTPSQYTKGVATSRSYPKDELPIYDDAIVFSYEEDDDDDIKLQFGSKDDVDDIADFYNELFDDEKDNILIKEINHNKDDYYARGYLVDECVRFEIEIDNAHGKHEKKLYESEAKIKIKPVKQQVIDKVIARKNSYIETISSYSFGDNVLFKVDNDLVEAKVYNLYLDNELTETDDHGFIYLAKDKLSKHNKIKIECLDKNKEVIVSYLLDVCYISSGFKYSATDFDQSENLVIIGCDFDQKDWASLLELEKVKRLHLINCKLNNHIKTLPKMTNLEYLDLYFTVMIGRFNNIDEMTNLKTLKVVSTKTVDFNAICKLTQLESLDIEYFTISDLSSIKALTNLKHLTIQGFDNLTDLSPLSSLTNLVSLGVKSCAITDLKPLNELDKLIDLDLYGNEELEDITPLSSMTHLRKINLNDCKSITDFSAVENIDHCFVTKDDD